MGVLGQEFEDESQVDRFSKPVIASRLSQQCGTKLHVVRAFQQDS